MTENLTSDDILSGAIDALQTRGHAKHVLFDRKGGVCLYGAFAVAAGYKHLSDLPELWYYRGPIGQAAVRQAAVRVYEIIFGGLDADGYSLVTWNNAPERTGEDVILALKRALHETSDV